MTVYATALFADGFVSVSALQTIELTDLEAGETRELIAKVDRYRILAFQDSAAAWPADAAWSEACAGSSSDSDSDSDSGSDSDSDSAHADADAGGTAKGRTGSETGRVRTVGAEASAAYFRAAVWKNVAAQRVTLHWPVNLPSGPVASAAASQEGGGQEELMVQKWVSLLSPMLALGYPVVSYACVGIPCQVGSRTLDFNSEGGGWRQRRWRGRGCS